MKQGIRKLIDAYVDELKKTGTIKSEAVEQAFRKVERHRLLEGFYLDDERGEFKYVGKRFTKKDFDPQNPDLELFKVIYSDRALLTRLAPPSSTSQPALVANMLELLKLERGMNLLEIGAGTGYNAALMWEIVGDGGHITTIDIQEDVVEGARRLLRAAGYGKIEVIAQDGVVGYPPNQPYDRIIATVGCPDISFRWAEQLADDGFMLIPLQHGGEAFDPLTRIWKENGRSVGRFVGWSGFMSIQGELAIKQEISSTDRWSLHSTEPTAEYPLFGFFKRFKGLEGIEWWREISAFPLFMSFNDERTCWGGLYDREKGAILIKRDKLVSYGDKSLYQDLKELYNQWEDLGRPGLSDWQLEFFPHEAAPEISGGDRVWVIERKFSQEIVRLESK